MSSTTGLRGGADEHDSGEARGSGGRDGTGALTEPGTGTRAVSAARLRWLETELAAWENDGLITRSEARAIRRR